MSLTIKSAAQTEFDLLTLGECMVRLSPPGHQRIELTPVFEAYAGGGEYNVSYALARYGLRTGWVSRLVDNPLGAFIRNHARASGMDLSEVKWVPYDGLGRDDRIGLNFTEVGIGVRPSVTMYDRGHSAASHMTPADVDWTRLFGGRGARWFHTGGIFAALSESCAETTRDGHGRGPGRGNGRQLRSEFPEQAVDERAGHGRDPRPDALHRRPDRQRRGLPEVAGPHGRRHGRRPADAAGRELQEDGRAALRIVSPS